MLQAITEQVQAANAQAKRALDSIPNVSRTALEAIDAEYTSKVNRQTAQVLGAAGHTDEELDAMLESCLLDSRVAEAAKRCAEARVRIVWSAQEFHAVYGAWMTGLSRAWKARADQLEIVEERGSAGYAAEFAASMADMEAEALATALAEAGSPNSREFFLANMPGLMRTNGQVRNLVTQVGQVQTQALRGLGLHSIAQAYQAKQQHLLASVGGGRSQARPSLAQFGL